MAIFKKIFGAKNEPGGQSIETASPVKTESPEEVARWAGDLTKLRGFSGLIAGISRDGKEVRFLSPATGDPAAAPLVFDQEVQACAIDPGRGSAATVEKDSKAVRLWDYQAGLGEGILERPDIVTAISWDSTGEYLAVGHKNTQIAILRVPSGEEIQVLTIPPETMKKVFEKPLESVSDVSFSPDGNTLAAIMGEGVLATWNLREEGKTVKLHLVPPNRFFGCRFSPDSRFLAGAAGRYNLKIEFSKEAFSIKISETRGLLWLLDLSDDHTHSVADSSFIMEDVFWSADGREIFAQAGVLPLADGLSQEVQVFNAQAFVSGAQSPLRKYRLGQGPLHASSAFIQDERIFGIVLGDQHLHLFSIPPPA